MNTTHTRQKYVGLRGAVLVLAVSLAACAPVGPASHEEVVTDTTPPVRFTMVNTDLSASEQNAVGVTLVPTPDADALMLLDDVRADLGAANGHGNARSLARALSPISLGGTANGVQLLRPDTIDLIFQEQANGIDLVLAMPSRWGIGYALPKPEAVPDIPDERICYWSGWGGSMVVMNPDRRTTFAYVMNKIGQVTSAGTERTQKYTLLIYQPLG